MNAILKKEESRFWKPYKLTLTPVEITAWGVRHNIVNRAGISERFREVLVKLPNGEEVLTNTLHLMFNKP